MVLLPALLARIALTAVTGAMTAYAFATEPITKKWRHDLIHFVRRRLAHNAVELTAEEVAHCKSILDDLAELERTADGGWGEPAQFLTFLRVLQSTAVSSVLNGLDAVAGWGTSLSKWIADTLTSEEYLREQETEK